MMAKQKRSSRFLELKPSSEQIDKLAPEAKEFIRRLYSESPVSREYALERLMPPHNYWIFKKEELWLRPHLLNILRYDEHPYPKSAAAKVLALYGDAQATPDLLKALKHSHPLVRSRAAFALGLLHGFKVKDDARVRAVSQALIIALNDPDRRVQIQSIGALGKIGRPYAIVPLMSALQKYTKHEIQLPDYKMQLFIREALNNIREELLKKQASNQRLRTVEKKLIVLDPLAGYKTDLMRLLIPHPSGTATPSVNDDEDLAI